MKEKLWLYFAAAVIIYGICLYLNWDTSQSVGLVIYSLIILSLSALKLLLGHMEINKNIATVVLMVALVIVVYRFHGDMLPVASILLIDISERISGKTYFIYLSVASIILVAMIVSPDKNIIIMLLILVPVMLFAIVMLNKLDGTRLALQREREEINRLRKSAMSQRKLAQTTEYAARINERNRLAGRIHDKIGHGMSGSILLLEAALLNLDSDKEKSRETVEKAANNLRESIDDIRVALREERSSKGVAGLSEIETALAEFEYENSGISAELKTEGNLEEVSPSIWSAIYENLAEALRNLLQHSDADEFTVLISKSNKLIRAEFKDNGKVGDFKPDIGLHNMEDRSAIVGGRCFFHGGMDGFKIVMTFKEDAF